jgi:hypothetical protein
MVVDGSPKCKNVQGERKGPDGSRTKKRTHPAKRRAAFEQHHVNRSKRRSPRLCVRRRGGGRRGHCGFRWWRPSLARFRGCDHAKASVS